MRTKKALRNTWWAIILQFITILVTFLVPRYVIMEYGSDVYGLTSTINQMLNMLNLLQAGAVGAAIFALYKPITKYDYEKISQIVTESKLFFNRIGVFFLFLVLIVSPLIAYNVNSELNFVVILSSFFILGIKSSLDFFFTSKYRIVFGADQRSYILSIAYMAEITIYNLLIFFLIKFQIHFIYMYVGLFFACIVKIVLLEIKFRKDYGQHIYFNQIKDELIVSNRKNVFSIEVAFNIISTAPIVILSLFYDLKTVSVFAIYNIVLNILLAVIGSVYNSFIPSFGNLVASENIQKINEIFVKFQFILGTFSAWLYMTAAFLITPFVSIYTSGIDDVNYYNPLLAILIICYGAINSLRVPYNIIVSSFGFFQQVFRQTIYSCIVSIIIAIIFSTINMALVLLGPIFFYLSNIFYQHYRIKKILPEFDNSKLFLRVFTMLVSISFSFALYKVFNHSILGFVELLIVAIIVSIVNLLFVLFISTLFDKKTVQQSWIYVMTVLNKSRKKTFQE